MSVLVLGAAIAACGSHTESTQSQTASSGNSSSQPSGASTESASASPAPATESTASASPAPASTETASPAPTTTAAASPPPVTLPAMPTNLQGPPTPWAGMNDHARADYMAHHVLPAMATLFGEYDPHDFGHVTCATCHGTNAREVHFHMPNRLPTLPMFGTDASRRHMAEHQRMYAFMHERVVPAMAQLLGEHPFDPQTRQGFGCAACHHIEGMH